MIIRPLTLTVNDDRATLSEGVTLYLGDYGICLEIQLKTVKYGFNGGTTHYESIEYADSCDVYVRRPSGDSFCIPNTLIEENKVHIYIEKTWTDEPVLELGEHQFQIVLKSSDGSQITIPPASFMVAQPIYSPSELLTEDGIAIVNELGGGFKISELNNAVANSGYVPIVQNGGTFKIELDLDNLVTQDEIENLEFDVNMDDYYNKAEIDNMLERRTAEIVTLTQAQYDALTEYSPTTLYVIVE
jgi:hypothetical protein